MKKLLRTLALLLIVVLLAAVGFVGWLSITEYKPEPVEPAEPVLHAGEGEAPAELTLLSWNIGYAGLDAGADVFMDGGSAVHPEEGRVADNLAAIVARLYELDWDIALLQEVDRNSTRTGGIDQAAHLASLLYCSGDFAPNYRCDFVPFPLPMIGRVDSGVMTLSGAAAQQTERVALPCPFSWPVRMANLKRCLLVSRYSVAGTDRELVVVNLHLEAYDDGAGKLAQTEMLWEILQAEYAKGNYVIAGGDFNQAFPGTAECYPVADPEKWTPCLLDGQLPEGWQYAFDAETPTCRLLDAPLSPDTQVYVIDGFILSPNVRLAEVETLDLQFENSDHNPVLLHAELIMEEE